MLERTHARARLIEDARRLADDDEAEALGSHLSTMREAQRAMRLVALTAVASLLGLALYALSALN